MTINDATARQIKAAQPFQSTWLSANAGSGKTRVLTDRVARLLLSGVPPQNILCLTFTKAAAGEMQNRLFKRLGEWTMLPDADLLDALKELGVEIGLKRAELAKARTLFANAIETPGGLKIQTIHSFCSSILRRFPMEAGVSPQFQEIDEQAQKTVLQEVLETVAVENKNGLFDRVTRHFTGAELAEVFQEICSKREDFRAPFSSDAFRTWLGLSSSKSLDGLLGQTIYVKDLPLLTELKTTLISAKGKKDQAFGDDLSSVDVTHPNWPLFDVLFKHLFKADNERAISMPSKPTTAKIENITLFDDLCDRLYRCKQTMLAEDVFERSLVSQEFATEILDHYEKAKMNQGLLDYDDLILKTRDLLSKEYVAAWVLFKMDGGIDHILIDEAQDTSPQQWEVARLLSDEFAVGSGARDDVDRTVFVVGDKKQSIYSFQGADPKKFDEMRGFFETQFSNVGKPFATTSLDHSFRSSSAILNVVDCVFQNIPKFSDSDGHIAFHNHLPGRVDVWPLTPKPEEPDPKPWFEAVDQAHPAHQERVLAKQIAGQIRHLCQTETLPVINGSGDIARQSIRPGDFLILVRGRHGVLFSALHQELKAAEIPVAGADRIKVTEELAVKDVLSLLKFLALQEDDLSLAEALRSPLFGWTEQDLFSCAFGRGKKYLWQALREKRDAHPNTLAMIDDLQNQADFLRPYDLIDLVLTKYKGRQKLIGRLGAEAQEGIDALLAMAISYEASNVPDLTGFLAWLYTTNAEIKREMDSVGDAVRIMTVHGAKGLEAPIVILPQCGPKPKRQTDAFVATPGGIVWKPNQKFQPAVVKDELARQKSESLEEENRLLYVAMTRAEKWLIVAGTGEESAKNPSWWGLAQGAVETLGCQQSVLEDGTQVQRYTTNEWDAGLQLDTTQIFKEPTSVPTWATLSAPEIAPVKETISPSDLGGDKIVGVPTGEFTGKEFGTMVHKFLEVLPAIPKESWAETAETLFPNSDFDAALSQAQKVLGTPEFAFIFAEGTLAEVDVSADAPELGGRIYGSIDRLIVSGDVVTVVDFKSNADIPQTAEQTPCGILRQMGAYLLAISEIYPNHHICLNILWTSQGVMTEISHDLLKRALQNTTAA